jgi:hypothetical protein
MHFSRFSTLAADFSIVQAHAFSQSEWQTRHYSTGRRWLCSGLSYIWLDEKLRSRSLLPQLVAPGVELLQAIATLQDLSYYPAFPEHYQPCKEDLSLLAKKYGTQDWALLRRCVMDHHQGDYVLYDLSRLFRYDSANIIRFPALPGRFSSLRSLPLGSAAIGLFRYQTNGKPDGHRFGYYVDGGHCHHFFDPNAGEVIESRDAAFHQWFGSFLAQTGYGTAAPSAGDPLLTLYILQNISPRYKDTFSQNGDSGRGRTLVERFANS